jgi:hypothetical protein
MMMDGVWERHSMRQCAIATVNVKAWRYVHPVCIYTLNSIEFLPFYPHSCWNPCQVLVSGWFSCQKTLNPKPSLRQFLKQSFLHFELQIFAVL